MWRREWWSRVGSVDVVCDMRFIDSCIDGIAIDSPKIKVFFCGGTRTNRNQFIIIYSEISQQIFAHIEVLQRFDSCVCSLSVSND